MIVGRVEEVGADGEVHEVYDRTAPGPSDWPKPEAIQSELPPIQPFSEELIPTSFHPLVRDVAERMQVPMDYPAVVTVLCLAGTVNRRAAIQPKANDTGKLETRITEIAIEIVLTAEIQHRESAIRRYQWRVERKAELEEEERKRKLEAERRERERLRRLEQGRIDRLLKDAAAFQQAHVIRNYVQAIRLALPRDGAS